MDPSALKSLAVDGLTRRPSDVFGVDAVPASLLVAVIVAKLEEVAMALVEPLQLRDKLET